MALPFLNTLIDRRTDAERAAQARTNAELTIGGTTHPLLPVEPRN